MMGGDRVTHTDHTGGVAEAWAAVTLIDVFPTQRPCIPRWTGTCVPASLSISAVSSIEAGVLVETWVKV